VMSAEWLCLHSLQQLVNHLRKSMNMMLIKIAYHVNSLVLGLCRYAPAGMILP
jgi:hypothetical protein